MRRLAILSAVVVALVCLSGVLVTADPGGGAAVIKDGLCNLGWGGVPSTDDLQAVMTPSGNVKLTCHFTFDPALAPPKAVKDVGFGCNTPWGPTTNSQRIVTPGGTALLVCMIKPSPNP